MSIKVGVICAGDRELAPFLEHINNVKVSEKAMLKIHEGTINVESFGEEWQPVKPLFLMRVDK